GRRWLLPVDNADADLHGTARHEERILRGGGLDLRRCRVLQRGLNVGGAIDRGDDDTGALLLTRSKIGANCLWVIDGEDGCDLGEAGQIALRDRQAAFTRALA